MFGKLGICIFAGKFGHVHKFEYRHLHGRPVHSTRSPRHAPGDIASIPSPAGSLPYKEEK